MKAKSDTPQVSRPAYLLLTSVLVIFLSLATITIALVAVAKVDYPLALFVRSFHNPLVERIGNIGNRLGDAEPLLLISVTLLGVGYVWKRERWWWAGFQSLLAHGVSAIATQIPKHLLGRPRPRWTHQDPFQFGPSLESGLDAFPSGHASASFAVAAVLARTFPRGRWLWYGAALFVALSRVVRGSHFPTDVLVGAWLGYLAGQICAAPLREWTSSIRSAVPRALPFFVLVSACFWVAVQRVPTLGEDTGIVIAGSGLMALGWGARMLEALKIPGGRFLDTRMKDWAQVVMISGFAAFTQSLLLCVLILLTFVTWKLEQAVICEDTVGGTRSHGADAMLNVLPDRLCHRPVMRECLLGLGWLAMAVFLHSVKGILPLV